MLYEHSIAVESPSQVRTKTPQAERPLVPLSIDIVRDIDERDWGRLLSEDRESTFFHTVAWGRILERALAGWERFFVVGKTGGRIVAGLPAMRYSKRGFHAVMSMPFGTYGGTIVGNGAPASAGEELAKRFFEDAQSARTAFAELVDFPPRFSIDAQTRIRRIEDETQILDLDCSFEELMHGFKQNNRNTIRKAEKTGLSVRRGRRRDDFLRYHSILRDCAKNWGGRLRFGEKFFDVLSAIENGSIQLWLAEYNRVVIAGLLNFVHNDTVMNWSNVMLRSSRSLSPMNLLHAEAIRDAVNRGYTAYNFGSSAGFKGVDWFKARFGTRRLEYRHFVMQKRWFSLVKRWSRRKRL